MRRPVGVKGIMDSCCLRSFFFVARSPLSPCFHPHSRGAIRFARCMLGVLVSAGAAICLVRPVVRLFLEWNTGQAINAVTGTRLWAFVFSLPGTIFDFVLRFNVYATAATTNANIFAYGINNAG